MRLVIRLLLALTLTAVALAACGDDGAAGNEAPGFSLPDSAGGTVSLEDYSGEPVLLYFHMADG